MRETIFVSSRRAFLMRSGMAIAATVGLQSFGIMAQGAEKSVKSNEEISPVEDLMREHGILHRLLLIYEESSRRVNTGKDLPKETLPLTSSIIRRFIEDYHEKLEEDEIFLRFNKARKLTDLVTVLCDQHRAGRSITDIIVQTSTPAALAGSDSRQRLRKAIREFICMYRPHAAREDTVLFPALRSIVPAEEYYELGEKFEDKEEELFGKGGFNKIADEVASLEKTLGIYELSQFTPKG